MTWVHEVRFTEVRQGVSVREKYKRQSEVFGIEVVGTFKRMSEERFRYLDGLKNACNAKALEVRHTKVKNVDRKQRTDFASGGINIFDP